MQIDRLLYPVTSLGPGSRLIIWTVGCNHKCVNCANPELWQPNTEKDIPIDGLMCLITQVAADRVIDGITITGGEPLDQIGELVKLLPLLRKITDDILIYSGYTLAEAEQMLPVKLFNDFKQYVSVMIDGRYLDNRNDNVSALKGSANQSIIFFDETKKALYHSYIKSGRTIQNVFYGGKMIAVGINQRGL